MRELLLFVPRRENRNIMTEFMTNVKSIITEAEDRYGHKIPISIIAAPEPLRKTFPRAFPPRCAIN